MQLLEFRSPYKQSNVRQNFNFDMPLSIRVLIKVLYIYSGFQDIKTFRPATSILFVNYVNVKLYDDVSCSVYKPY